MRKRHLILAGAALAAATAWYVFRPELLFIDRTVQEELRPAAPAGAAGDRAPPTTPVALLRGTFRGDAHETTGTATVYRLEDGRRVLRLTEFETSNGPDVVIYLVAAAEVRDASTVKTAGFVSLGSMKGNRGNQNYDIPAEVDLDAYRSVSVWCRRFGVNFGAASLREAS